ncbi:MAG: hypothetical protein M5R36_15655 [Deltaproteobacteria bacterium]|nr:hypothetical protein [Deltaproteobacteria bacterium]
MREAPAIDRDMADRLEGFFDRFVQLAQFYLEHAIAGGFARPCDARVVAQSIVGMGLRHANLWANGAYDGESLETLVDNIVDFAFRGFGAGGHHEKRQHQKTRARDGRGVRHRLLHREGNSARRVTPW